MANTKRITINLSDFEYKALLSLANKNDRSLAWLGRQAIVQFINKHNESITSSSSTAPRHSQEKILEKSDTQ